MMKTFTRWRVTTVLTLLALVALSSNIYSQSIARQWSDVQLSCIRKDRPRPTVQARHLAQGAIVMWDAFAVYDDDAQPVLLGQTFNGFTSTFNGIAPPADVAAAQHECLSYAMYRYLWQRYATAPTWVASGNLAAVQGYINDKMTALGYDPAITSTDYSDGDPAKLGNYIAAQMQAYALQDGANQAGNFGNTWYAPMNGHMSPHFPNNPNCFDPNRWQPLCLTIACEQGTGPGFPLPCDTVDEPCNAPALSPEFGEVKPFALTPDQITVKNRDSHDWKIYLDPGDPPYLDLENPTGLESIYKWGYVLNIIWHSMHTSTDGSMQDISPASIGNVLDYPDSYDEYPSFYDMFNGGDTGDGYDMNPATGLPYDEQIVPRGDYTRVLSQYWADGPNSETPPGHWFKIVNEVNDNPLQVNMWNGEGEVLGELEWDVRSYLAMGGAILDAAIACWSAKGYYDYTRPIFAIRAMCDYGQCSDDQLPNYHPAGIPLVPGYIELIEAGDPLAGANDEFVNDIKVYTWLGPEAATGEDGVGWKRGSEWWTYQNATFVTPPFPGFYSGHSTYSRSGAEVMELITGDEYFPGGMGEFVADPGYLSADTDGGPSVQVRLQWAKYRDASDQCSLSRIYGGLHPPQDDIAGRNTGAIVGPQAFAKAETYMTAGIPHISSIVVSDDMITDADAGSTVTVTITFTEDMNQTIDPTVAFNWDNPTANTLGGGTGAWTGDNEYTLSYTAMDMDEELSNIRWHISGAQDLDAKVVIPAISDLVRIDTRNPSVETFVANDNMFNAASAGTEQLVITFSFDEPMADVTPSFAFSEALNASVVFAGGVWLDNMNYEATFNIADNNDEFDAVGITITAATDAAGNAQVSSDNAGVFSIDTKEPVANASADDNALNQADAGNDALTLTFTFDETMDNSVMPTITFPGEDPTTGGLEMTFGMWNVDATQFIAMFDLADMDAEMYDIEVASASAMDVAGNMQNMTADVDVFSIDTKQPMVTASAANDLLISDANTGVGNWSVDFTFDEDMDTNTEPLVSFPSENPATTLQSNSGSWSGNTYTATFNVLDAGVELEAIDFEIMGASDAMQNGQLGYVAADQFDIDTHNPEIALFSANDDDITDSDIGSAMFQLVIIFDEEMDMSSTPAITFPDENPSSVLTFNASSDWLNSMTYVAKYNVLDNIDFTLEDIDINVTGLNDAAGNEQVSELYEDYFDIHVGVGVTELGDQKVTIYPNPAVSGKDIVVAMSQIPADLVLQVFDTNGALIDVQTKSNQSGTQMLVDTQNLAAGSYFINLSSGGNTVSMKVQVTK